jgi:hypothetical protein
MIMKIMEMLMLNKNIVMGLALVALSGCTGVEQTSGECVLDCTTKRVLIDTEEVCEFVEVEVTDRICMTVNTFNTQTVCANEIHCDFGAYTYVQTECNLSVTEYADTVCGSGDYAYFDTSCTFSDVEYTDAICDDLECVADSENNGCNNGGGNGSEDCSPSENGNEDEFDTGLNGDDDDDECPVLEEVEVCLDYEYTCEEATCEEVEVYDSVEVCLDYSYSCDVLNEVDTIMSGSVEVCIEEEDCWDELIPVQVEVCDEATLTTMVEVCSENRTFESQTTCDESSCDPDAEWVQGGGALGNGN